MKIRGAHIYYGDEESQYAPKLPKRKVKKMRNKYGDENWAKYPPKMK